MPIFGVLASIASLTIVVLGLPAQIRMNYRTKSCGIAPSIVCGAFLTYLLWTIHGWVTGDIFLKVSQTPGTMLSFVLVLQWLKYRKKIKT